MSGTREKEARIILSAGSDFRFISLNARKRSMGLVRPG
jgi:hypothetical protein